MRGLYGKNEGNELRAKVDSLCERIQDNNIAEGEIEDEFRALWHFGAMETIAQHYDRIRQVWLTAGPQDDEKAYAAWENQVTKRMQKMLTLGTLGVPKLHKYRGHSFHDGAKINPRLG